MPVRVLVVPGSFRSGSLNTRLAGLATKKLALRGADVTRISLGDYALPIYDGDLEEREGVPANAKALARHFTAHDAVLIVSPEYNASIPPVLSNAFDWMSRDGVKPFRDRVFGLACASAGHFGGVRVALALRQMLEASGLGALVIPEHFLLPNGGEAFDEQEELRDRAADKRLEAMLRALIERATALKLAHES
ncbi:NADPH-dependent FMN reductase [Afifella sp. IM 167]|uniref:NADPH-dependent FMN reductase n=1 Tax=Afifella sp. IM 167 TaxID=2033586 RepID=UPI001CCABF36|nr:NAD(P)H-dependent oxidoreductase [Afifella sp. IM 167]MBZ8133617.1 NADPH-dependent FMN reductase [Afifella sp. IM 167]